MCSLFVFSVNGQNNPSEIPGIIGWYNSQNVIHSNGIISEITDLSALNYNLVQSAPEKRPQLIQNELGGMPSIEFNGTNNTMKVLYDSILTDVATIFIINSNNNDGNFVFDGGNNVFNFRHALNHIYAFTSNSSFIRYNHPFVYGPNLFTFNYDGPNSKIYENSNIMVEGSLSFSDLDGFTLGSAKGQVSYFFGGKIFEVIIFDRILSQNEQSIVENFLMNKYAPSINLGLDFSINYGFCDTTISSPNYYNSYLWNTGSTDSSIVVSNPGLYWLETVDVFGRTSRDSIIISRPPYDEIHLQNQQVCFNEADTISANLPQGNYTFIQWSDGNTNPVRILNQNESISYTFRIV